MTTVKSSAVRIFPVISRKKSYQNFMFLKMLQGLHHMQTGKETYEPLNGKIKKEPYTKAAKVMWILVMNPNLTHWPALMVNYTLCFKQGIKCALLVTYKLFWKYQIKLKATIPHCRQSKYLLTYSCKDCHSIHILTTFFQPLITNALTWLISLQWRIGVFLTGIFVRHFHQHWIKTSSIWTVIKNSADHMQNHKMFNCLSTVKYCMVKQVSKWK